MGVEPVLRRIDMVALYVRDWPAALGWYRDRLGLAAVYVEEDHRFAVLAFPDGGPVLHLVGDPRPAQGRSRCVANVLVKDFDATLVELVARGVEIVAVQEEAETAIGWPPSPIRKGTRSTCTSRRHRPEPATTPGQTRWLTRSTHQRLAARCAR